MASSQLQRLASWRPPPIPTALGRAHVVFFTLSSVAGFWSNLDEMSILNETEAIHDKKSDVASPFNHGGESNLTFIIAFSLISATVFTYF
jgi:hypothetical protein